MQSLENILQAWVTLGWEFEHSETSVDQRLEETTMTRLLAPSHSLLSRCHRLGSAFLFGKCLTDIVGTSLRRHKSCSGGAEVDRKWFLAKHTPLGSVLRT